MSESSSNDKDRVDDFRPAEYDADAVSMNATWGWIAASVFIVVVLAAAFGIGHQPTPSPILETCKVTDLRDGVALEYKCPSVESFGAAFNVLLQQKHPAGFTVIRKKGTDGYLVTLDQ